MTRIKTIDGDWHTVIESKSKIDEMMGWPEVLETGILKLNMKVTLTSYKDGFENKRQETDSFTFLKHNILYYS